MIREGTVVSIDTENNSGLIEDRKGKEYIFTGYECKDDQLPSVGDEVSFVKDQDFVTINVATMIVHAA